jgi:predicted permease
MARDLVWAMRSLRRSPFYFWATTLLLGVSLATCTVLFSLVDALFLREMPVRGAERLVRIATLQQQLGTRSSFLYEEFGEWKRRLAGFEDLFAWSEKDFGFEASGKIERARVHFVTSDFFRALDGRAAAGRLLGAGDAGANADDMIPVVLSFEYWQRRFGGDPGVVGRVFSLGRRKARIAGVSAAGFKGLSLESSPELRAPIEWLAVLVPGQNLQEIDCEVAGRVRVGIAPEAVRQEAEAIWRTRWQERRGSDARVAGRFVFEPAGRGVSRLRSEYGKLVWLLLACAGMLTLLVSVNVAGFSAVRAAARREELALRAALGAGRKDLVWGLAAEVAVILGAALIVAAVLTLAATPRLVDLLPPLRDFTAQRLAVAFEVKADWSVFGFGAVIALGVFGICGVWPAVRSARGELNAFLKSGGRVASGWRGRQALVAAQIALCTVLLFVSGLTTATISGLEKLNPGFAAERVVTFSLSPRLAGYSDGDAGRMRERLVEKIRELPEVEAVAVAARGLMRGSGRKLTVAWAGERARAEDFLNSSGQGVSGDYFETMQIPLLKGRIFSRQEQAGPTGKGAVVPVVVNRAFEQRLGDGWEVLGRRCDIVAVNGKAAEAKFEVVGVVADARYRSLREPFQPIVYGLIGPGEDFVIHARTRGKEDTLAVRVRTTLEQIDPRLNFFEVTSLEEEMKTTLWAERMAARLGGGFAAMAVWVSGAGLYALLAYWVAQRKRELAIRVALGARRWDVYGLVFWRGGVLAVLGVSVGLAVAYATAPLMSGLLYGVEARAVWVFAGAAAAALAMAAVAVALLAVSAMPNDATNVLRAD